MTQARPLRHETGNTYEIVNRYKLLPDRQLPE